MKSRFTVWCPDNGHDGPEDGSEVDAYDAEDAAVARTRKMGLGWAL